MFQVAIFVKNCKFRMKCVEKYDAIAFGATQFPWLFLNISVFQQNSKFLTNFTRKGSKAYLSSSERYLTLHIIRHRA